MIQLFTKYQAAVLTVILGLTLTGGACSLKAKQPPAPANPAVGSGQAGGQAPAAPRTGQDQPAPQPAPQPEPEPVAAGPRISVEDESARDPELAAFIKSLREAVAARDRDRLLAMMSDDIKYTFGVNNGKQGFIKHAQLDTHPVDSPLWSDLDEILSLGGAFLNDRLYFAPNFFVHFPDGYDQFQYLAVIGEGAAVRESPDPQGAVLSLLSYTVVKAQAGAQPVGPGVEVDGKSYKWVPVVLPDGRKGYILDKFVRHPLEARLGIGRTDGGTWQIQVLVAGD